MSQPPPTSTSWQRFVGAESGEARLLPAPIDASDYDLEDAAGTIGGVPDRWRWTVEGLDEIPGPALVAMEAMAEVLRLAGGSGSGLPELVSAVERSLRAEAGRHGARTSAADAIGEHNPLLIAVEECERLLSAAGRSVVLDLCDPTTARLERVNVSDGGPAKEEVGSAAVGPRGLRSDRQAGRRHHGRPFQAVSLWSAEVIAALGEEGHPVRPGSAGENLTVAGLEWPRLRIGTRLAVGAPGDEASVLLEVTSWAPPCSKVAGNFAERDFHRIDHDLHAGWARAYARVLRTGTVAAGDTITVLP